jgi:hypothetical protein
MGSAKTINKLQYLHYLSYTKRTIQVKKLRTNLWFNYLHLGSILRIRRADTDIL